MTAQDSLQCSILLPFRDAAATLQECLDSIAAQTLAGYEVVAVDDHSSDGGAHMLAERARLDPRLRLLANSGSGLVDALNFGLSECRHPLVVRMDSDDCMHPQRLAQQVAHMQRHSTLAVLGSAVALLSSTPPSDGMREYLRWLNACQSEADIREDIYVEAPFAHPSVCYRRDLVLEHGGYRHGAFPEDYDLWLRLQQHGARMQKLPATLLHWRDHPQRLSRHDPRCSRTAFDRLRARYLARDPRLLAARDRLVIWGAGRRTRQRVQRLLEYGFAPQAWVDIDPRKIGNRLQGVPVIAPQELAAIRQPFVLSYVANHGARALIAAQLEAFGLRRGDGFLSVG